MIVVPGIAELAAKIAARAQSTSHDASPPYTLFLGAGCARAAAVPSAEDVARQVLMPILTNDPDRGRQLGLGKDNTPEQLRNGYYKLVETMSTIERYSLLQSVYGQLPLPAFYQDIASLIKAGFFTHVMTTSLD